MDTDYLARGILRSLDARFVVCRLSESAREACRRHHLSGAPARLLSEALTGCALLGSLLKPQEKLTLQVRGEGALKSLMADIDEDGHVRGAVSVAGDGNSYETLAGSPGTLVISCSLPGKLGYQGHSRLTMGDFPADLALHCSLSQQVESFMRISYRTATTGGTLTGGLLLQALPGADLERFEALRSSFECGERDIGPALIDDPTNYTLELLQEFDPHVLIEKPLSYSCTCSRARVQAILQALGREELQTLISEDHGAEVVCHWCGQAYTLNETDLVALLADFSAN